MQKRTGVKASSVICAALAVMFLVFSAYMLLAEHNEISSARRMPSYAVQSDVEETSIPDAAAPVGVRNQFCFTLGEMDSCDQYLMFFTLHQTCQVQIDGETVYSLSGGGRWIGKTPSNGWAVIPLKPSDSGSQVTVTLTPMYEDLVDRKVEFAVGSKYAFFEACFRRDVPQILLASLSILIGIAMIGVQLYGILKKKTSAVDTIYLGMFALVLGIWRMLDTWFSALMFPNSVRAKGYIALLCVFVLPVPLLMYLSEVKKGRKQLLLRPAACFTAVVAMGALALQVLGIADLREVLPAAHVMMLVDIVISVATVLFYKPDTHKERIAQLLVILVMAGSVTDLILYYYSESAPQMTFSLFSFLICAFLAFLSNSFELSRKAYMDGNTKLFNRSHWDKYLEEGIPANETVGVMMLDLNSLKKINDTLGHEVGDKVIADFATILRKTFGSAAFLCRWGGDEFAILVRKADREKMAHYVLEVHKAVDIYNGENPNAQIHFACGFALSSDYPALTRQELLAKADDFMYQDKQRWYRRRNEERA